VPGDTLHLDVRSMLAAMAVVAVSGCAHSPITATRIEAAIETTFANLVALQVARLALPPVNAAEFAVSAICRKQIAGVQIGSGDWTCTLAWRAPDRRPLRDTYDLFVNTDGCYTATVAEDSLGGPTLKDEDGRDVKNLLYVFEGCFDTT
jgi:hypothetical protein